MTTLLRITCFILSLIPLHSCGLIEAQAPLRVVRVKALADPSFRERNPRWVEELRARIEAASAFFEGEFDLRIATASTGAWPERERIQSTASLMVKLKNDFPLAKNDGAFDFIVAFTAERLSRYVATGRPRVDRVGDCRQGLGSYVVTTVGKIFRDVPGDPDPDYDTVALAHEFAHIFGAEHVKDIDSIMNETFDHRLAFDVESHNTILKNRFCPFAK